jgi:predicted transcriptional regulator
MCSVVTKQTEDIKVRVDRFSKLALEHLAETEQLALSDIVRRALKQFIEREIQHVTQHGKSQN